MASERTLHLGDVVMARPCRITITGLSDRGPGAQGWCDYCQAVHVVNRIRYERGVGPWYPVPTEELLTKEADRGR